MRVALPLRRARVTPAGRVLVADDEPSIRFVLRETLEAEGFEVTDVDNGDAALAALGERRTSSPSSTSACPDPAASSCSSGSRRWAATPRS